MRGRTRRARGLRTGGLAWLGSLALACWGLVSSGFVSSGLLSSASAQDRPYQPWLSLVDFTYQPASGGGKQVLKYKFDVSKDLPIGTKVQVDLLHIGLELEGETQIWEFKGPSRSGVQFETSPVRPIGADKYALQVQIPWDKQSRAVQQELESKKSTFPENQRLGGWICIFSNDEDLLTIGTPEEFKAQAELMCRLYEGYIAEVIENNDQIVAAVEEAKEGKRFHDKDGVDAAAAAKFIRDWRIQQGKTQIKLRIEFPEKHRAVWSKSLAAHQDLIRLAQMVSKRGVQLQQELEQALSLEDLTPKFEPDVKGEKEQEEQTSLRDFDARYRYTVKLEALGSTLDRIYELVCPPPPPEPAPEDVDPAAGDAKKDPAPGDAPKKDASTGN